MGDPLILLCLSLLCRFWTHRSGGASGIILVLSVGTSGCIILISHGIRYCFRVRPICLCSARQEGDCLWHGGEHCTLFLTLKLENLGSIQLALTLSKIDKRLTEGGVASCSCLIQYICVGSHVTSVLHSLKIISSAGRLRSY